MKIKSKTKKIIVLSVMVALLIATGVLNFVLNDKLNQTGQIASEQQSNVAQTFFAAARSERDATRESEFLYLDAIMNSEASTEGAKATAQEQKLALVDRMEKELALETLIKGKGFEDVIVTIGDSGVSIVVGSQELTVEQANQILSVVVSETTFKPTDVNVIPYN
ncbi:MAG: SpoIIIAH-like family protein [Christensenellales bacterium]